MQVSQQGSMAFDDLCQFLFIYYYQEKNNIEDEGCEYLLQANWPQLTKIRLGSLNNILGKNEITNVGCKSLGKSHWKKLLMISLGISCIFSPQPYRR